MLDDVELLAVDLDGTLADTAPDIAYCLGRALESAGREAPGEEQTRVWIGDGLAALVERALSGIDSRAADAAELDAVLESFVSCYGKHLFDRSRLYPRAAETLDALRSRGISLCCITNKRLAFANEILSRAGVRDRFELVLGGDSLREKKPSPAPLEAAADALGFPPALAAMVGDSRHDFGAARSAGYSFVWAAYGYGESIDFGSTAIARIDRFSELDELLRGSETPAERADPRHP